MKTGTDLSRGTLLATLTVLFLALTILNNALLRGVRLDLTANNLYTLSEGTRNILEQIQEPINLYLFFSEKETKNLPLLRNYHNRVKEMLEEYRLLSGGKLNVRYVNPEAFSEEEDRATQLGLQAATVKGRDKIYFGLAGTNALDTTEVIPFLQSNREAFLEYDLGKLIYSLVHVKKPVLGLMTDLPMYPTQLDPATGRMNRSWIITEQLEQLFDVQLTFTDTDEIAEEVDVLMVVHPKGLPEKTMYAIDQFIMRGGRGLFFIDPHADADQVPQPADTPLQDPKARGSSLNRLFRAWGFSVDDDTILVDNARALPVTIQAGQPPVPHPAVLSMRSRDFNNDDVVMDTLESVNFYLVSHVRTEVDAEIEMTPLVRTSAQTMPVSIQRFRFIPHPRSLLQGFTPTGERYPIAARIQGAFKSAFDGRPEVEAEKEASDDEKTSSRPDKQHIAATEEPGIIAVVADTDVLTDRMWAQTQMFFGQRIVQPYANNRDFIINLVDNLFGSSDLISIRSRASYSYPFTRVQKIEEQATRKYQATEQSLQNKLRETEAKLQELQQQRSDKKSALLTASQRAEVRKFREKKVEIRKKLRNVRHQLVKDIENLGTRLKMINIITMPVVITGIALLAGFLRVRRRKRGEAV